MIKSKDKDEFTHFLDNAKSYLLDENVCFQEDGVKSIIKKAYGSSVIKEKTEPKKLKKIRINRPRIIPKNPNINYENINTQQELKKINLLKDGYNENIIEVNPDIIQELESAAQLNEQVENEAKEESIEPSSPAEKLIYRKVFGCDFS